MMIDLEEGKLIDRRVTRPPFRIHMVVEEDREVGHRVTVQRSMAGLAEVDHMWERTRYSVRTEDLIEEVASIAVVDSTHCTRDSGIVEHTEAHFLHHS